jgi:hypothetical protein
MQRCHAVKHEPVRTLPNNSSVFLVVLESDKMKASPNAIITSISVGKSGKKWSWVTSQRVKGNAIPK